MCLVLIFRKLNLKWSCCKIYFDSTILKFPTQIDSQNYNEAGKMNEERGMMTERIRKEFGMNFGMI